MKLTPDQVRNICSAIESLTSNTFVLLVADETGVNVVSNSTSEEDVKGIIGTGLIAVACALPPSELITSNRN